MIVAAAGGALAAMVARICASNPKYTASRAAAMHVAQRGDALRGELLAGRLRDEAAFQRVIAAGALPRATPAQQHARARALEEALHEAAAEPLRAAGTALEVLQLCGEALAIGNRHLISDIGCATEFAEAALRACAYNVRINHRFMKDADAIRAQQQALEGYERAAAEFAHRLRTAVNEALTSRSQ